MRILKCLSYFLILLSHTKLCVFAQNGRQGRIFNGTEATIENYPFIVSIQWYRYHLCGGVIISTAYILTSARCIESFGKDELKILAGSTLRNKYDSPDVQERTLAEIIIHNEYNALTWQNDIAIIKLSQVLAESEKVKSIGFYEGQNPTDPRTDLTIIGWGVQVEGASFYPIHLHQKPIQQYDTPRCIIELGAVNRLVDPKSMFCALAVDIATNGYIRGGPCDGDWGGPLVTSVTDEIPVTMLVGLASWGFFCNSFYPKVFTNLQGVRNFIYENTGIWGNRLKIN